MEEGNRMVGLIEYLIKGKDRIGLEQRYKTLNIINFKVIIPIILKSGEELKLQVRFNARVFDREKFISKKVLEDEKYYLMIVSDALKQTLNREYEIEHDIYVQFYEKEKSDKLKKEINNNTSQFGLKVEALNYNISSEIGEESDEELRKINTYGIKTRTDIYILAVSTSLGILFLIAIILSSGINISGFPILLLCLNITGWIVYLQYFFKETKFKSCSYCDKSILIKYDWQCDYCDRKQGKERYIFDECLNCGRKLKTIICEHCHKEMRI